MFEVVVPRRRMGHSPRACRDCSKDEIEAQQLTYEMSFWDNCGSFEIKAEAQRMLRWRGDKQGT